MHVTLARPASMAPWVDRQAFHSFKFRRRSHSVVDSAVEAYLREDIPCGSPVCLSCHKRTPRLPEGFGPYVIPSAAALEDLLEVFELPEFGGLILLTSVMRKVLQRGNLRTSLRLRQLYTDLRRETTVFDNLHANQTAPTTSERCNGADLMKAAWWYHNHLEGKIQVIVLQEGFTSGPAPDYTGNTPSSDPKAASILPPQDGTQSNASNGDDLLDALLNMGVQDTSPASIAKRVTQKEPVSKRKGVEVLHPAEYFEQFWKHSNSVTSLVESLRIAKEEARQKLTSGPAERGFPAHLVSALVESGLGDGSLLQGVIHMSQQGPKEAVVQLGSHLGHKEVLIPSKVAINRAVHGDTVAVRLWPPSEWVQPTSLAAPTDEEIDSAAPTDEEIEEVTEDGGQGAAAAGGSGGTPGSTEGAPRPPAGPAHTPQEASTSGRQPAGEVVAILVRAAKDIVVAIEELDERALQDHGSARGQESVLCVPLDRRLPRVRLKSRELGRLVHQRFVVHLDAWDRRSTFPSCHLVRVLGPINNIRAETEAVLAKVGIEWRPFTKGAMAELPPVKNPADWCIPEHEAAKRRDLRGPEYLICSIDPPGCTDVDDALSVRWLDGGSVEVGVHIADVTYFIQQGFHEQASLQGSLLDQEAYARGTTVYLMDRRLDMLPSLLSEHLCSLRADQDRLAVSVLWTLSPNFEVQDIWFGRTIIRSHYQLAYRQAQDILDGKPAPLSEELPKAARAELRPRLEALQAGALELESAELRFETSAEGKTEVHGKETVPMMAVVAEMMIWANAAVAVRTSQAFPGAALLRRHPPPRLDAFEEIAELCERGGRPLDISSSDALAKSLEAAFVAAPDAATASLIKSLAARAMSEAEYFATGDGRPGAGGMSHFGLALSHYTHFTSPIRRYADMVVHRQLLAALQTPGLPPLKPAQLSAAAGLMNERNRQSKRAQRECHDLFFLMTLFSAPQIERALVYAVRPAGLLLFLPKFHIRAAVHLLDRGGVVRGVLRDEADEPGDPSAIAGRKQLKLETGSNWARIVDKQTGATVYSVHAMQRLWVQLSASGSRSHGPALRVDLLHTSHPGIQVAERAEALHAGETGLPEMGHLHSARGTSSQKSQQLKSKTSEDTSRPMSVTTSAAQPSRAALPFAQSRPAASMAAALNEAMDSFLVDDSSMAAAERSTDEQDHLPSSSIEGIRHWLPLVTSAEPETVAISAEHSQRADFWHAQGLVSCLKVQAMRRTSGSLSQDKQQLLGKMQRHLELLAPLVEACK